MPHTGLLRVRRWYAGFDYNRSGTVPFGRPPALPDPFAFDLDTTGFL
ncbi:hypothetical protein GCM10009540_26480 [Streptomyces turgidiscabies]